MLKRYIANKIIEGYEVENGLTFTRSKTNIFWKIYRLFYGKELTEFVMNKSTGGRLKGYRWERTTNSKQRES